MATNIVWNTRELNASAVFTIYICINICNNVEIVALKELLFYMNSQNSFVYDVKLGHTFFKINIWICTVTNKCIHDVCFNKTT